MENGKHNLIPVTERSKEEARKISAKGGRASGEARRKKKAMRKTLEILLAMPIKGKGKVLAPEEVKSFETLLGKNFDVEVGILLAQVQKALKGDTSAFIALRDTSGNKPVEELIVDGDAEIREKAKKYEEYLKELPDDDCR